MLSISNVGASQASNYYDKDGYYARMEDNSDHWQGCLKEDLNLPDNVTKEDFNKLVHERKERAGFDLCFSAPKSVSVAMVLGDTARQDMIDAHNAAVTAALEQIEKREIGARITKNGITEHVKTGNMIAGKFNHYVSRNSDPQLHTHTVILNKTRYNDKYYAVDNCDLYKNKILYGQIYRNALAKELMNKGYEITTTDQAKGFLELKGINQEALDQFSSRRQEIVEKLKEWGANTPEAASKAAIMTRQAKEHKDLGGLMESWKETLNEMGGAELTKADSPIVPTAEQQQTEFEQAVNRLAKRSFAFKERDLKKAVLAAGVGSGMTEAEYEKLVGADAGQILVALGSLKNNPDGEAYFTTKKNLETEKEIFNEIRRTRDTMPAVPGINKLQVNELLNQRLAQEKVQISQQQRKAVIHIATTQDQYTAVQGLAGTGKTTHMLKYVRQVLETYGYEVKGACYTGKAAQGLQEDASISSSTIHSFLNHLEREAGNQKPGEDKDLQIKSEWDLKGLKPGMGKEAWIVDEASMVDNGTLHHLMEAAKAKGAKVILVGDRQQLLPVGVGNAFSVLTETGTIGTVKLDEIRRQKSRDLLQAVREIANAKGDLSKSLELIAKDTQVIEKHKDRINAIVKDYTALNYEDRQKTVVLTAANKDRRLLNESIRNELKQQGKLSAGKEFKVEDAAGKTYTREFTERDKVIFLQNDNRLGVRNGQTGLVTKIDGDTITVSTGGKEINIDLKQYKKLDHGYAMTTHKAQGITTDRALINLDSSQKQLNSRNAFYVDISRARQKVTVYTDDREKIEDQIRDFAKKITSEDFLIPAVTDESKTIEPPTNLPGQTPDRDLSIKPTQNDHKWEIPLAAGITEEGNIYLSDIFGDKQKTTKTMTLADKKLIESFGRQKHESFVPIEKTPENVKHFEKKTSMKMGRF